MASNSLESFTFANAFSNLIQQDVVLPLSVQTNLVYDVLCTSHELLIYGIGSAPVLGRRDFESTATCILFLISAA